MKDIFNRNIVQKFARELMSDMLDVHVIIYLDDILVYSDDPTKHKKHVHEMLRRLRQNGLYCKPEKSHFDKDTVHYLGFVLSQDNLKMDQSKVQTIQDWPEPQKVKDIQSFLSFENFYHRFISNYSNIVISALKSGLVSVLLPFLEGPRIGPVPESFRMQEPWTRTAKNRSKLVVTGLGMNTIKHVLYR